jgi:hypothetical protein
MQNCTWKLAPDTKVLAQYQYEHHEHHRDYTYILAYFAKSAKCAFDLRDHALLLEWIRRLGRSI